jgi:SAM-dependent methyltransferase
MYESLEAKLHDVFWAAEGEAAELPLIEDFLRNHPGKALELGCGSGRLLLPLLEKGFVIEGLDNSGAMLALCRERAAAIEPVLHHAAIEDFQATGPYEAITIPAFTLQLIEASRVPAVLARLHRLLEPGGGLYLTTFIPWAELTGELEENQWFLDKECPLPAGNTALCHTRFQIRRLSQTLAREHRYELLDTAGRVTQSSTSKQDLCWFWPREMTMMLASAGFTLRKVIGDFSPGIPCDDDSQMITCIANRDADVMPRGRASP